MTITGGFYNSTFSKGLGSNVSMFPVPVLPGPNTHTASPVARTTPTSSSSLRSTSLTTSS